MAAQSNRVTKKARGQGEKSAIRHALREKVGQLLRPSEAIPRGSLVSGLPGLAVFCQCSRYHSSTAACTLPAPATTDATATAPSSPPAVVAFVAASNPSAAGRPCIFSQCAGPLSRLSVLITNEIFLSFLLPLTTFCLPVQTRLGHFLSPGSPGGPASPGIPVSPASSNWPSTLGPISKNSCC